MCESFLNLFRKGVRKVKVIVSVLGKLCLKGYSSGDCVLHFQNVWGLARDWCSKSWLLVPSLGQAPILLISIDPLCIVNASFHTFLSTCPPIWMKVSVFRDKHYEGYLLRHAKAPPEPQQTVYSRFHRLGWVVLLMKYKLILMCKTVGTPFTCNTGECTLSVPTVSIATHTAWKCLQHSHALQQIKFVNL